MENGIHYDELSEEDKEEFEKTFEDDEEVDRFRFKQRYLMNGCSIWIRIDMVLDKLMEDFVLKEMKN